MIRNLRELYLFSLSNLSQIAENDQLRSMNLFKSRQQLFSHGDNVIDVFSFQFI